MTLNRTTLIAIALVVVAPIAQADDIAQLKADVAALKGKVTEMKKDTATRGPTLAGVDKWNTTLTQRLKYVTVDDKKTMWVRGCNVQICNDFNFGEGANGLGNLIIGWNTPRNDGTDNRTGSHNLIMGVDNNYTGVGGIVNGSWNGIGSGGVVLNGYKNLATGPASVVLTGANNQALGSYALIGTGYQNVVVQDSSSSFILTGKQNAAWGTYGGVLTGYQNSVAASVNCGLVFTGEQNSILHGNYSAIVTGVGNQIDTIGKHNVIGTGRNNRVKMGCESVFLADGDGITMDYNPKTNLPWKYKLASESRVFVP